MEENQLPGDELTGTEQSHFDEFSTVEQMAAGIEGEPIPQQGEAGYQPEPPAEIPTSEILAPVINMACAVLAPSWNIQPAEQQALAENYANVIDKYFPGGVGQFGPELSALLVTAAIITPRLGTPRKPEPKPEKEKSDNEKTTD